MKKVWFWNLNLVLTAKSKAFYHNLLTLSGFKLLLQPSRTKWKSCLTYEMGMKRIF